MFLVSLIDTSKMTDKLHEESGVLDNVKKARGI